MDTASNAQRFPHDEHQDNDWQQIFDLINFIYLKEDQVVFYFLPLRNIIPPLYVELLVSNTFEF